MPPSTVTKLIDRLEAAGYVRRNADPSDREIRRCIKRCLARRIYRTLSAVDATNAA